MVVFPLFTVYLLSILVSKGQAIHVNNKAGFFLLILVYCVQCGVRFLSLNPTAICIFMSRTPNLAYDPTSLASFQNHIFH